MTKEDYEQAYNVALHNIDQLQLENERLRKEISDLRSKNITDTTVTSYNASSSDAQEVGGLTLDEYKRYGRQMIVPQIRKTGQLKLKNSKVLVVGAGGLGCPALAYLAGAGIGTLGIIDHDTVDVSNLHRQIIHSIETVGMLKCESAVLFLKKLNPNVIYKTYPAKLSPENAYDTFQGYDVILDCTDTPKSRYLISDVAVHLKIPLVSASGLKTEGQLSILNYQPDNGPCYRCFFPNPPPANSVTSCQDGGIMGPVIGIMGVMMAIETIKIITGAYEIAKKHEDQVIKANEGEGFRPFLMLFSAYSDRPWKFCKMRGRQITCISNEALTRKDIESGKINYEEFCGSSSLVSFLKSNERISVFEYQSILNNHKKHILIDVRPTVQFEICSLKNSISIPLEKLKNMNIDELKDQSGLIDNDTYVYSICRYGNDSQTAVRLLKDKFKLNNSWDIKGGLNKWATEIDASFPIY